MYYLVYNSVAGRGRVPDALAQAEAFFARHGLPLTVLTPHDRSATASQVSALPADARILVLGGDGTLNVVLQSSVGTDRVIGVLPAGSADDFSFALGLDRNDLTTALETVRAGCVRRVDVGRMNGRFFLNSFGSGFDADVTVRREAFPRWVRGDGAYLLAVFATLARLRNLPLRVQVDGETVHEGPALLVSVQNGPRTGGSFLFSPTAQVDDGLFDVVIAGQLGRFGTLQVLPRVFSGRHLEDSRVQLFQGQQVQVEWAEPRHSHLEGEIQPQAALLEATLLPGALRVFAPPPA